MLWNVVCRSVDTYFVSCLQWSSLSFSSVLCSPGSSRSTPPGLMSSKLTQPLRRTGFLPASRLSQSPIFMTAHVTATALSVWMDPRYVCVCVYTLCVAISERDIGTQLTALKRQIRQRKSTQSYKCAKGVVTHIHVKFAAPNIDQHQPNMKPFIISCSSLLLTWWRSSSACALLSIIPLG